MTSRLSRSLASPIAWRVGLLLAASVAVVAQLASPLQPPSEVAASGIAGVEAAAGDDSRSRIDISAIAAHPLTQASREPWIRAAPTSHAAPQATLTPPSEYALAGLVLGGDAPSAILKPANLGKALVIGEGETLNGWTLRRIDALGLHFESDGRAYDLGFAVVPTDGR